MKQRIEKLIKSISPLLLSSNLPVDSGEHSSDLPLFPLAWNMQGDMCNVVAIKARIGDACDVGRKIKSFE